MNISGLRTRIVIQKNVTETDKYGNHKSLNMQMGVNSTSSTIL